MGNLLVKMAKKTLVNKTTGMVKDAATGAVVGATTGLITKGLGIDDTLAGRVIESGVPAMLRAGEEDESVGLRLFDRSKKKDRRRPRDAKESERGFFDVFGPSGKVITKAVSEDTGATEEQVGSILGSIVPDLEDTIAEEDPKDVGAMRGQFGREVNDAERDNPSFARMMTKMMF